MSLREYGAEVIPDAAGRGGHGNVTHRTIMLHEAAKALGPLPGARARPVARAQCGARRRPRHRRARVPGALVCAIARSLRSAILALFDAIVSPPAPAGAPASSSPPATCCGTLWSLAGFPAITLPIGRDAAECRSDAARGTTQADARLLAVAAWCEERLPFIGAGVGGPW